MGMIYTSDFIKIGSGIKMLLMGIHTETKSNVIS
jgi:hypothetical protein